MSIRSARIEDADAIGEVHAQSWKIAYRGLVPQAFLDTITPAKRARKIREYLGTGYCTTLVAETDGQIQGFVDFAASRDTEAPPRTGEIFALYVHPQTWSRGLGRELMTAALTALEQAGFTSVTLWVLAGNERAIRFYEFAGFVLEPNCEKIVRFGDSQPIAEYRMRRRLPLQEGSATSPDSAGQSSV